MTKNDAMDVLVSVSTLWLLLLFSLSGRIGGRIYFHGAPPLQIPHFHVKVSCGIFNSSFQPRVPLNARFS